MGNYGIHTEIHQSPPGGGHDCFLSPVVTPVMIAVAIRGRSSFLRPISLGNGRRSHAVAVSMYPRPYGWGYRIVVVEKELRSLAKHVKISTLAYKPYFAPLYVLGGCLSTSSEREGEPKNLAQSASDTPLNKAIL